MVSKGFICEVDLNLHLLSTLGNYECPSNYVYLTVEIFGKVHQTEPQHSYYPLVFNKTIQAEKTFWSASFEDEVLDMLEDVPVVIELRRIDPCFYSGILLAYYDGNAKDFLFSPYPRLPCSTNGREVSLNRAVDFKGTAPRLRYSAFADIRRLGGELEQEDNNEKYDSMYNREDDGYYSPTQSMKDVSNKPASRGSRSPKRASSPSPNDSFSAPYYTRQTVSSAIRGRSPSPVVNRSGDNYDEKDFGTTGDSGISTEKSKDPFVVRKVSENLINRSPKLHDPIIHRGRSRIRSPIAKNQETLNSYLPSSPGRQVRSISPRKLIEVDNNFDSYKPSRYALNLRSSYEHPHNCYRCSEYSYSPLVDYYTYRYSKPSYCSSSHYRCQSHCCQW